MYRDARNNANLTAEEAIEKIHVGRRTLFSYEAGETIPPADVVLEMSKAYGDPYLTQNYCREFCAIGNAYSYIVLNNVNLDPSSIMLKLIGEMKEAHEVLYKMLELSVNKNSKEDFTDREKEEFINCFHEFIDVEHNIETLKISIGKWFDVSEIIQQHNKKCLNKGYAKKEKDTKIGA